MNNRSACQHLLDAGPVLCLGASTVMADLYDAHLIADGLVVATVADEVRGWASVYVAPGDPHRKKEVKRAGAAAVGRYTRTLLATALPTPEPQPAAVAAIRRELERHAERKRPGRMARAGEHGGETYSIYEAGLRSICFITNDGGARHVAGMWSVTHQSFVDLMRRLVKSHQDVNRRQIVKEMQRLGRNGIDVGDVVNSVLDLR